MSTACNNPLNYLIHTRKFFLVQMCSNLRPLLNRQTGFSTVSILQLIQLCKVSKMAWVGFAGLLGRFIGPVMVSFLPGYPALNLGKGQSYLLRNVLKSTRTKAKLCNWLRKFGHGKISKISSSEYDFYPD